MPADKHSNNEVPHGKLLGAEPHVLDLGGVFNLAKSTGYNQSERFLSALCRLAFLNLWSLPNTYRSPNRELIDTLVVFGDDVVLFSDKHIELKPTSDPEIGWSRWCRSAVDDSLRQLNRAKNWLRKHPERVFLDRSAANRIPISLPLPATARYHLVATARGSFEACSTYFDGGYGSLVIDTAMPSAWTPTQPFRIGRVSYKGSFVHVFDESAITLVLSELDTISDFVAYLVKRESFLGEDRLVRASGEEHLLAAYLSNSDESGRQFHPITEKNDDPKVIQFDDSHAPSYFGSAEYRRKKLADRQSYLWDELIETFVEIGNPGYAGFDDVPNTDVEHALRIMASEPRFMRRVYTQAFLEFLERARRDDPMKQHFRVAAGRTMEGTAYVFFIFPKRPNASFQEYRRERTERLEIYLKCLLAKHPRLTTVVGLGFDHPLRTYHHSSEDLLVAISKPITSEERTNLIAIAEELGILGEHLRLSHRSFYDYPPEPGSSPPANTQTKAREKSKDRRKQASKSRKKNRT